VQVRQVQLDELFALLSAVREGEVSKAEAIERLDPTLTATSTFEPVSQNHPY
jgi:hypothetical protein